MSLFCFLLFFTLPLTMLIWKPFSFYPSCQILSEKYWFFPSKNIPNVIFSELEKNKFQFLDSGSTFSISVMNLSIYFFQLFWKIFSTNYDENIWRNNFGRKYLTNKYAENIWRIMTKIFDEQFWRKYLTKNMTKIFDE